MEYVSATVGAVWRLLAWLPGFVLRFFFSKVWLAQHTVIDLRPRHDPVTLRASDLPEFEIWLVVTNRGHFPVELDRLSVELSYAAARIHAGYFRRTEIGAGNPCEVFVRGALSAEQVAHIGRNRANPYVALQVHAEFNCKLHNFSVDTGQLSGVKPELQGFQVAVL